MTLIAAVKDGDVVLLAGDSATTAEDGSVSFRLNAKIWQEEICNHGNVGVGFTGLMAVCQALRYGFDWPKRLQNQSFQGYLASRVQPQIAEFLQKRFHTLDEASAKDTLQDWQLLVVAEGDLYVLYPNGDVELSSLPFAAIGDGAQVALGSMYSQDSDKRSWEVLESAFAAARAFRYTVGGPVQIVALYK